MIHIDGSQGEGGGQILRSALSLSMVTGTPFQIHNIRAQRSKPGLLRQHLTAVEAAARISQADVHGHRLHSRELAFAPRAVRPGTYAFDIGSSGSTTLVLETVLPPLILAGGATRLSLVGGTHNPSAPPFDFLEHAVLPVLNRMGARVVLTLERPGFYPRGGGRLTVSIESAERLSSSLSLRAEGNPIEITERDPIRSKRCVAAVAGLPRHIAERELGVVQEATGWPDDCFEVFEWPAEFGPGNIVSILIAGQQVTEVFSAFGKRGVRAERVAGQAVDEAMRFLAAGVPVGQCLADQLLLPLALAGGGRFKTLALSSHSRTNIAVIGAFLDVPISARALAPDQWMVEIGTM